VSPSRALWLVGPHQFELRPTPVVVEPGQVRVHTLFSGISRGTERLVWRGGVPERLADTMRAPFQEGVFPWPVKYGYSSVGVLDNGRHVFCLFPHQSAYAVPVSAVQVLPDGLPPARAVLAANMETALNAVWDAQPGPGDRVAVVGAGVVGCLVAWLIGQIPGTEVCLVDVVPERETVARQLGVAFSAPEGLADSRGTYDLVVHASGSEAGLATALEAAGVEAVVLELSWYGDRPVSVPLGLRFHPDRLTLRSSQVGRIPTHRSPRWDYSRRLSIALKLLRDPVVDVLIDSESAFNTLPSTLPALASGPPFLCHRVRYDPAYRDSPPPGGPPCSV